MEDIGKKNTISIKDVLVLYVEDEDEIRNLAAKYLRRSIPNLLVASSGEEALKLSEGKEVDILITDINMKAIDGVELAAAIKNKNPSCYVILATGYSDSERLMQALNIHVDKYIIKPVAWKELVNTVLSYSESVLMVKNTDKELSIQEEEVSLSDEIFRHLSEAVACIDEGIEAISRDNTAENNINSIKILEKAKEYIEEAIKIHS